MREEKLDLILNVLSEIKIKQSNLEKIEGKEEFKNEIKSVSKYIDRLEKDFIAFRINSLDTRVKVRELENRLTRIENHIGIAI